MLTIFNIIVVAHAAKSCSASSLTFLTFLFITIGLFYKFLSISSHILLMMLILEFFMLSILMTMAATNFFLSSSSEMLMLFFTLAVCEASIGLGLLIQISRVNGSEQISVL